VNCRFDAAQAGRGLPFVSATARSRSFNGTRLNEALLFEAPKVDVSTVIVAVSGTGAAIGDRAMSGTLRWTRLVP
jgi:hypothetical protein